VAFGSGHPDDFCWTELDAAPEDRALPCREQKLAPPPARTEDQIATCLLNEFAIVRTQYALLEDGTLRHWQVGIYPLGQVVRGVWVLFLGLAAGIGLGIIIVRTRQTG
jgi:hypothetical protein